MSAIGMQAAEQFALLFDNLEISMRTMDWSGDICGAQAWRYVYHTLHSCDKWLRNPAHFEEPALHVPGLDQPDTAVEKTLSRSELEEYMQSVRGRSLAYLRDLTDEQLGECPLNCAYTRFELLLGQLRHFMCHVGILNGVTLARTGKYPRVIGLTGPRLDEKGFTLFEE